jgi:dCTP deaminase
MSIKSDRWIEFMAKRHNIIAPFVDRCISANVISYGLSSFGYDMRAGNDWKIFTDTLGAVIDPKAMDPNCFTDMRVENGESLTLPPNSYALTHSIEYFRVPRNITCLCIGKSTYARCGVHVNITPLEAGWEGQVTIEISNGTRLPVKLYAGEGIAQVLFFEGEEPSISYADRKGKYQKQEGVVLARVSQEDEASARSVPSKRPR